MNFGINLLVWSGQLGLAEMEWFPQIRALGYCPVELPLFAPATVDNAIELADKRLSYLQQS